MKKEIEKRTALEIKKLEKTIKRQLNTNGVDGVNNLLLEGTSINTFEGIDTINNSWRNQSISNFYTLGIDQNNSPIVITTYNSDAEVITRTNSIKKGGELGLNLSGENIEIGVWDGGTILSNHPEFLESGISRIDVKESYEKISDHATHVAGTIGAKGKDFNSEGMATKVNIKSYDFYDDLIEMIDEAKQNLLISNHSYGRVSGWVLSKNKGWIWYGIPSLSEDEDASFGFYDYTASNVDEIAYNSPYYLIVKAAGNDRGDGPKGVVKHKIPFIVKGRLVYKTVERQRSVDGGEDGYDTITDFGLSKNVLTVGALRDCNREDNCIVTNFSGFGPTDDGRIKPDICGNGHTVYSTSGYIYGDEFSYVSKSGTSMASPNVSGSLALLQELNMRLKNNYLKSHELKGLVIHTATSLVGEGQPTYKEGWGVLNCLDAAKFLINSSESNFNDIVLQENQKIIFKVRANSNDELISTICWTDPHYETNASKPNVIDENIQTLVNDLNIVVRGNNSVFYPYILNRSRPQDLATKGENHVDNIEKVYIGDSEINNIYEIEINHSNTLRNNKQNFSLLITGGEIIDSEVR